jgi:hypothetical protein
MSEEENYLEVNDYLDLYLLSGSLGDNIWQEEILGKLQTIHHNENTHQDSSLMIDNLWKQYKMINVEILALYNLLQKHPANEELKEKIWNLRQQRISISSQIKCEERKSQY